MQLAVVEFARNVRGLKGANTTEVEKEGLKVESPVIAYLPGQERIREMGATMRLGGHDVLVKQGTVAQKVYKGAVKIRERFRHRYEVNPSFVKELEQDGLVFSGKSSTEDIMQIMELSNHPYFLGCQFHPELKSTLLEPAPLFLELLRVADERA